MNDVAVIIPVYHAHDTIKQTLYSVFMQRVVDFAVYLVVDGPEDYTYLSDLFPVNILQLDSNSGPAVARQFGIDHSSETFITFVDADDTLVSSLALFYQLQPFSDSNIAVSSMSFLQENKDHSIKLREKDMVWMHGKMYRRSFLNKYNIRFNDSRANEDVGFNTQCQCLANENEQIFLSHDVTYMWQWRDNSTVRTDNNSYMYNESVDGYVINKVYAFEQVLTHTEINDSIKYFIIGAMGHLFKKYLGAMLKAPKQMKHIMKWCKVYYRKIFTLVDKEYLDKAEKVILAQSGLDKLEYYEEFLKWKLLLKNK